MSLNRGSLEAKLTEEVKATPEVKDTPAATITPAKVSRGVRASVHNRGRLLTEQGLGQPVDNKHEVQVEALNPEAMDSARREDLDHRPRLTLTTAEEGSEASHSEVAGTEAKQLPLMEQGPGLPITMEVKGSDLGHSGDVRTLHSTPKPSLIGLCYIVLRYKGYRNILTVQLLCV